MLKSIVILFFSCFTSIVVCNAQQIKFNESPQTTATIKRYIEKNKSEPTIKGWRIQIISTDDRRKMEKTRTKFNQIYPDIHSSWKHVAPYYQLRAGAYADKNKMMAFLMELKEQFPTATPVVDDIEKSELLR